MANQSVRTQSKASPIVFYHAPHSRSIGVRWLLEELGVNYELRLVNVRQKGSDVRPEESYRSIQPHQKVPALVHGDLILHERAAITLYLADRFPEAGLAPTVDDPMRAAYLTMNVYHDSVFDPCVATHFCGVDITSVSYSFGRFEDTIAYLKSVLGRREFAAGERFTAADVQLASALEFTMFVLGAVPKEPEFLSYVARATDRPAYRRAQDLDAELIQQMAKAPPRVAAG